MAFYLDTSHIPQRQLSSYSEDEDDVEDVIKSVEVEQSPHPHSLLVVVTFNGINRRAVLQYVVLNHIAKNSPTYTWFMETRNVKKFLSEMFQYTTAQTLFGKNAKRRNDVISGMLQPLGFYDSVQTYVENELQHPNFDLTEQLRTLLIQLLDQIKTYAP